MFNPFDPLHLDATSLTASVNSIAAARGLITYAGRHRRIPSFASWTQMAMTAFALFLVVSLSGPFLAERRFGGRRRSLWRLPSNARRAAVDKRSTVTSAAKRGS
jgi:hypothetical protein